VSERLGALPCNSGLEKLTGWAEMIDDVVIFFVVV